MSVVKVYVRYELWVHVNVLVAIFVPTEDASHVVYNIVRALVLSNSYLAIMNKIFMYAQPCSIK